MATVDFKGLKQNSESHVQASLPVCWVIYSFGLRLGGAAVRALDLS